MLKLDVKALGLSCGILWGGCMLLMGILAMTLNWGTKFVEAFSLLYVGYKASITGSIIGALWGFVDGGIGGILIAWLYNKFAK